MRRKKATVISVERGRRIRKPSLMSLIEKKKHSLSENDANKWLKSASC